MEGPSRNIFLFGITMICFVHIILSSAASHKYSRIEAEFQHAQYSIDQIKESSTTKHLNSKAFKPIAQKQCVMYDVCGKNPEIPNVDLNCVYNGSPKRVDDDSLLVLEMFCPELVQEYGNDLCCSGEQIQSLATSLALPQGILDKCPSCYYNFRQLFCHLTCSPYQSQFLHVNETVEAHGKAMVETLDFMVNDDYTSGTYDSCKNVMLHPSTGSSGPAMDYLCGPWGASNCSAHKLYDFMGWIGNGFTPFSIQFSYIPHDAELESYTPFNYLIVPCNQISPDSDRACSCLDCPSSPTCPA